MTDLRPGGCKHPQVTDEELLAREDLIRKTWGDAQPIRCPDCHDWLYPHETEDGLAVYDEPFGAGADPAGRPDPSTHPEYWSE